MTRKSVEERGGLCCPYCADSKFPCVTMEKQMRKGTRTEESKPQKNKEG